MLPFRYLLFALFVFFLSNVSAQDKAINYKELQNLLPSSLNGYALDDDKDGANFDMNGMSYSMAAGRYIKGESNLTVTLMDYKGAAALYQASTMAWTSGMSYEDDNQKAQGVTFDGFSGWEVIEKNSNTAQLIVGYKERYLITVEITEVSSADLNRAIVKSLKLSSLP